ncbi:MAG: hypothetical protein KFH98_04250 [Gemmatimonadetes bacterium]|nr:hypothetical protein [Gemmatimonadota bacterium]
MISSAVAGPAEQADYQVERECGALVVALPSVMAEVLSLLRDHGTLYDAAAARPAAETFTGRGAAYRMTLSGTDCIVRHYRRGGAVAHVLRDEYLRAGEPRPLRELHASIAARARGVDTPEVVAAIAYLAGPLYRADLATQFVPDSRDLAEVLFGSTANVAHREAAWRAAGAMLRTTFAAGVEHADLNLRNILIAGAAVNSDAAAAAEDAAAAAAEDAAAAAAEDAAAAAAEDAAVAAAAEDAAVDTAAAAAGPALRALLIDLDKAVVHDGPVTTGTRSTMLARLHRSRIKFEQRLGRQSSDDELRAFEAGLGGRVD